MRRLILLSLPWLAACAVAPPYHRPPMPLPQRFSEAGVEWRQARPAPLDVPPDWWKVLADPDLGRLEARAAGANADIQVAAARYRAARAALASARAGRLPSVTASASASRGGSGGVTTHDLSLGVDATWEPDLWGRLGLQVKAAGASAEAAADDLAAARLSVQVLLAQTWYRLRAGTDQRHLLERTLAADARFLALTRNRHRAGVASGLDVAQAETQLANARAQLREADLQLARYAHALAALLGEADMSPPKAALTPLPPVPPVPALIPSTVLERRPDIAAAERRVAAANAQVGVAATAWYPTLTLGASAGLRSDTLARLFSVPSRVWSLGPSLATTLFDAGARTAALEQAKANHAETAASYRQTVLTAFQEVEDNLASARLLAQEAGDEALALAAARRARTIAENQYRAGIVNALDVISAQTAVYGVERTVIDLHLRRIEAALQLLKTAGALPGVGALSQ